VQSRKKKGVEIMFGKKIIDGKMTNVLTGMLVMVVAGLFLISFATQVNSEVSKANIKGEVIAVDDYAGTVTVRSMERVPASGIEIDDKVIFTSDKGTNVTSCTQNRIFRDIGEGAKVTVTYHEAANRLVADVIDIAPVAIAYACYDE
jgi:hypothetical protein